jgi:hypothetical protein
MEAVEQTHIEQTHTFLSYDRDVSSYVIHEEFVQKIETLYGDELYNFFLTFSFEQLDDVAMNYQFSSEIMFQLYRAILAILEKEEFEAIDHLEDCIEHDIGAGISSWGGACDFIHKKQKAYMKLIKDTK